MKRLDEMTAMELAGFTDEQVENLIDLELAYAGVVRMEQPSGMDIPEPVKLNPVGRVYKVLGVEVGFTTEDATRRFFELKPVKLSYNWMGNGKYHYICPSDEEDVEIINVFDKTQAENAQKGPQERVRVINEAALAEYRDNYGKVTRVAEKVWQRVIEAREFNRNVVTARATFNKYLAIVEDDDGKARELFYFAYKDKPEIMIEVVGPGPVVPEQQQ